MDFPDKIIDAFQLSGAALAKFQKQAEDQASRDSRIAAEIPAVVAELVKAGMVEATERDDLARALADPEHTLQLLKSAAQHSQSLAAAPGTGGQPVSDTNGKPPSIKKASVSGDGGGYVGRRGSPSPAWDGFNRALGIG